MGQKGKRDWHRVARVSRSLLIHRNPQPALAEALEYRGLCQGLRQMCDFGTYGDFGHMSGDPDESAMLALASNTGKILDSEGVDAANQYLVFTYDAWIEKGGGKSAIKNGMLDQELGAADVPAIEAFSLRNAAMDSEVRDWWTRYPDLLTMQCRE